MQYSIILSHSRFNVSNDPTSFSVLNPSADVSYLSSYHRITIYINVAFNHIAVFIASAFLPRHQ